MNGVLGNLSLCGALGADAAVDGGIVDGYEWGRVEIP